MTSFSDEQLVKLCKAGSQHHCGLLFERYKGYVAHIAWQKVGDTELVRDLVQETFLKAINGIKGFKQKSSFKTWLTKIIVNLCKDHYRRAKATHQSSHVHLGDPEDGGIGEIPAEDPATDPEGQLLCKEQLAVALAALDELSHDHKTVVLLRVVEGFSYKEIAKITNTPMGTVGRRIHDARMELRRILKAYMKGTGR